jgi:osmotically-inducible protein OsmY
MPRTHDYERRYGQHVETDEGDSSVRGGTYDEGRERPGGNDWRQRHDRDPHDPDAGRYGGRGGLDPGNDIGYGGRGFPDAGPDRYRSDYGYGRGGRSNYEGGRPDFGRGGRLEGQFRRSGPGGFGQAQGSSAWRGYGVDEDDGNLRGRDWREPYGEARPYASGPHRGKGPKGYQRSDERLREMLCERLRDDPNIDASDVSVSVQNGLVTLEGTVDSRSTKIMIEDVAEQFGVDDVQNNLRVQRPGHVQPSALASQDGGTTGEMRRRSN